jgi:hypothetical protein
MACVVCDENDACRDNVARFVLPLRVGQKRSFLGDDFATALLEHKKFREFVDLAAS